MDFSAYRLCLRTIDPFIEVKTMRISNLLTGFILLIATAGVQAVQGEFDDQCTMGLATQKNMPTDCSINWTSDDGKTYCFGSEEHKAAFLKDPAGNLKKAQGFYQPSQE
jgi:YHS domain-containing protein